LLSLQAHGCSLYSLADNHHDTAPGRPTGHGKCLAKLPEELSFCIQQVEPDDRILQTLGATVTISSAIAAFEVLVE
jgi:hypothetical protein